MSGDHMTGGLFMVLEFTLWDIFMETLNRYINVFRRFFLNLQVIMTLIFSWNWTPPSL